MRRFGFDIKPDFTTELKNSVHPDSDDSSDKV